MIGSHKTLRNRTKRGRIRVHAGLLSVCLGLGVLPTALAHPVSLSRAQVVVHSDRINVMIEAPAEDLLHFGLLEPNDGGFYHVAAIEHAAQKYCDKIRMGFVVRDESGAMLSSSTASCSVSQGDADRAIPRKLSTYWINTEFGFHSTSGQTPRFVTFQHVPDPTTTQVLLTRMGTTIRQADCSSVPREVVLTSGGNTETLEFEWPCGKAAAKRSASDAMKKDARKWLADERFKTIHAIMQIDDSGVLLRVVVPAPIAETWQPIRRSNRDVLSRKEQRAVAADWKMRLSKRIGCMIDGKAARVVVERVSLIGAASSEMSASSADKAIGFHSARIVGRLRLSDTRVNAVDLSWKLFNEAVPAAKMLVLDRQDATEFAISSYDPVVHWRPDN